jgi:hypothetical protein
MMQESNIVDKHELLTLRTDLVDVLSPTDEANRAEPCSIFLQCCLCCSYDLWVGLQHVTFT